MSKKTSGLPPSHPLQAGTRWEVRACMLVFLCILLVWTDLFAGWTATPAHAATVPNPNPVLKAPSFPSQVAKAPDLGIYVQGQQSTALVPIPHPQIKMPAPQTVTLTTLAQQIFSQDGTFELDVAAGSVSAAQIQAAGGTISLTLSLVEGASGGGSSGRVFLGTYQIQLSDAQGQPLTNLVLAYPFTFRYHAPAAQQGWFWQDQSIDALWQPSSAIQTSVTSAPTTTSAPVQATHLLLAQKDANAAVWSVSTNLGVSTQTTPATKTKITPVTTAKPATTATLAPTTTPATTATVTPVPTTTVTPATTATATLAPTTTPSASASVAPAVSSSTITFSTEAPTAGWGKAKDVDVGLSSGSLNYSYPLSLPSGPGGLMPPLNLSYSSGSVNESHNVQGPASWVGQGWGMNLGSISWTQQNVTSGVGTVTLENNWSINDPSGLSGQLIPPGTTTQTAAPAFPTMSALSSPYIWHTAPESHAKVQEVNFNGSPCWHVWLPNGTMEEFGCVDEARQSAVDASGAFNAYRWDLDLIADRYGNQVRVHYQRNYPAGGNVRDAVISSIEYDDPACHNTVYNGATAQCSTWHPQVRLVFDASMKPASLTNATGCQNWTSTTNRCDDPVDLSSSGGLPIAKALTTYVLNDLKVQVNGNLLREYVFSYNQAGPQTITDPYSGQPESVAGYLILTKIAQLGTAGTALNAPTTTMGYIGQTQHYIDIWTGRDAIPGTNCGNTWTPHDPAVSGLPCFRWEKSFNSYYLSSIDNGMGWHANFTWQEGHSNTHGVDGGAGNDPFNCDGKQTSTNLCGQADDRNWSRILLVKRVELTNGVSSTWSYRYYLQGLSARPCANCVWGNTWGNQNDADTADYYNGQFTSYANAVVTNPDNSSQVDYFASTIGWGLASSGITCYEASCNVAPYWNPDPASAGKLKTEQDYNASGALMQVSNTVYTMNCPPTGVAGSLNAAGAPYDPGPGYLFSQMDHNNPVVVCDPRPAQTDTYQVDGITDLNNYQRDARVVHKTVVMSYDGDNRGVGAYDYGNVNTVTTTTNDVNGSYVHKTAYYPNDNLRGSVYLTDLPAFVTDQNSGGTYFNCVAMAYGNNASAPHPPLVPGVTQQIGYPNQSGGCVPPTVITQHTYDGSGNPITATDADGHKGCTRASIQASACGAYDSFGVHLLVAVNAKNQVVSYTYGTAASGGYGQWLLSTTDANAQSTSYTYDILGRLTSIIEPGDTQSLPTTSYTYINKCTAGATAPCLELDTITRVTSGSATTTTTRQWFDGMGRLVETQSPGPNSLPSAPTVGSFLVTYTLYDNMGRATTTSLPYAIAASATPGYVAPDLTQARTVTTYDSLGRPTSSVSYGLGSVILSESTTRYTVGQGVASFNVGTTTPFEQTITLDAYHHQSIQYTDGIGQNRYEQVFSGTGSPYTVLRTVQYNRDEVGNVTSVVTYDNTSYGLVRTNATFDGLKRRIGFNDWDLGDCNHGPLPASCRNTSDNAWKYTYDGDGNVLSQTDPRNVTTYTSYDNLDRPLCRGTAASQVNPCQSSAYATFFYDSYNNSSNGSVTFPSGCTAPGGTSAPVGAKIAETFSNASGSGWRCNGYDARGQTIAGALSVTADGQTTTQNVSMTYNDLGAINSLTYPDGETVTSNYDSNGRVRSAYLGTPASSDPVAFLSGQVSYINSGQLAGLAIGGTANKTSVPTPLFGTTLGYDGMQRLNSSSATRTGASSPFWSQQQTYDNAGNILHLSTMLPTVSGGSSKTDTQSFCYDALDRVTWAGNTGTPVGGDHCGATPTGSTTPGYSQPFSYDVLDRITQGSAGTVSYGDPIHIHAATGLSSLPNAYASYDVMGNMTCRNVDSSGSQSCASGTQTGATMSYDNEGRLATWTAPKGSPGTDQFLYDNEGNRVLQRSSSSSVTDTITFDGYSEVVITGGTSTITNYFSVAGQRVAMRKGAILSYLLPDFLGSSSVALKNDGSIQAVQLYAPYGGVRYTDQIMPTDYSFTGQRLDSVTGLLYDNARYYDGVSGRFISADQVQNNTTGMDPYAYVGDNPIVRTDPSGKCWPLCTMLIGAAIGAVVGVATTLVTGAIQGKMPSGGEIAQAAVTGAVAGAITGLAGPEAGPLARVAVGAVANAAGQAVGNAMQGKPIMDGVGQAAITGAITGGVMEGAGALAGKIGGQVEEGAASVLGDAGCGLSFRADTLVTTPKGKQAISTLKVGDHVQAYNPATKKVSTQTVQHVFLNHDNDLIDVTLAVQNESTATKHHKVALISHGSHAPPIAIEVVHTTQKHPWLTTHGWIIAGKLQLGDKIQSLGGAPTTVIALKVISGTANMYDLTVSNVHTFAVGAGQWVVHNCLGTASAAIAKTLEEQIPENARGFVTVAHAVYQDTEGNISTFASMSSSYLSDSSRTIAVASRAEQLGATFLEGADHAEANILNHPLTQDLQLLVMSPSRPFCASCALSTIDAGGTTALGAPIRNDFSGFPFYEDSSSNWYTPSWPGWW